MVLLVRGKIKQDQEIGKVRGLDFLDKEEANIMVVNSLRERVRWVLTPMLWLVRSTQIYCETYIFILVILLGHKVPNLRLVGPNLHYSIFLIDFAVSHIMVIVRKEGIVILIMVSWVTFNRSIP